MMKPQGLSLIETDKLFKKARPLSDAIQLDFVDREDIERELEKIRNSAPG